MVAVVVIAAAVVVARLIVGVKAVTHLSGKNVFHTCTSPFGVIKASETPAHRYVL